MQIDITCDSGLSHTAQYLMQRATKTITLWLTYLDHSARHVRIPPRDKVVLISYAGLSCLNVMYRVSCMVSNRNRLLTHTFYISNMDQKLHCVSEITRQV